MLDVARFPKAPYNTYNSKWGWYISIPGGPREGGGSVCRRCARGGSNKVAVRRLRAATNRTPAPNLVHSTSQARSTPNATPRPHAPPPGWTWNCLRTDWGPVRVFELQHGAVASPAEGKQNAELLPNATGVVCQTINVTPGQKYRWAARGGPVAARRGPEDVRACSLRTAGRAACTRRRGARAQPRAQGAWRGLVVGSLPPLEALATPVRPRCPSPSQRPPISPPTPPPPPQISTPQAELLLRPPADVRLARPVPRAVHQVRNHDGRDRARR